MAAGYSGTPLVKKLGLKPGARGAFVGAPPHFVGLLSTLPEGFELLSRPGREMDYLHLFASSREELDAKLPALVGALAKTGTLWISWPKKTSALAKDLTESGVREAGLAAGVVDVKVCAVDEDWSGLKFMFRLKDR